MPQSGRGGLDKGSWWDPAYSYLHLKPVNHMS